MHKVEDLPENVPERLVQAAAVRAVIEAAEGYYEAEQAEMQENLELHMREAEAAASIHGHVLGEAHHLLKPLEQRADFRVAIGGGDTAPFPDAVLGLSLIHI